MYKQAIISRTELLSWLNDFLCTNYVRLEDASNGAVACQIIDAIHPGYVPMKQLDFSASTYYECQKNYGVLRTVFSKLKIPIDFDTNVLSKQGSRESYEFLSKLKSYFDVNYKGGVYDAVARRSESKGTAKVSRTDAYTPSTPRLSNDQRSNPVYVGISKESNTPKRTNGTSAEKVRSATSIKRVSQFREGSFSRATSQETVKQNELLRQQHEELKKRYDKLEEQICELNDLHNYRELLLAEERLFYYNKLRKIEDILRKEQEQQELTSIDRRILEILYSTEGIEYIQRAVAQSREWSGEEVTESMNSDDRVSDDEPSV